MRGISNQAFGHGKSCVAFISAKAVPRSEVAMSKINLQVSLVNVNRSGPTHMCHMYII